ncbi:MBL fold metallo-hydrolase [Lysinimonas soli]|uniref:MBL fold metallo-hydrolase n=1 Tax=Lysinimonas soli TaxID=1074233 RepID=A0ABW0NQ70_9MICO
MQPTNPAQFDDAMAGRMPEPDEIRDGIWSIPLPMSQPGNPFSLSYAVQGSDGSVHLIDTGYDTERNWQLLVAGLARFGLSIDDVASVFVTHLHPDHLGMAERLRAASGARLGMLRREQLALSALAAHGIDTTDARFGSWGVPEDRWPELRVALGPGLVAEAAPAVDRAYEPRELIDVPGRSIEALATPGHTAGSASLVDAEAGLVFTGDTVLPRIFSGLGLGDAGETNPIADYLASLRTLEAYDELEVAPGHQYRFRGLAERTAVLAEHHLSRSRAAAAVLRDEPDATIWQVASRLRWTTGWQNLRDFYLFSALGQTQLHVEFGRSADFPG